MLLFECTFHIEKTLKTYTITYVTEESSTLTLQEGQTLGDMPVPSMDGHIFLGWFTESGEEVTAETVPVGDMTLYPKWEEIPVETEPTVPTEPEVEEIPTQPTTVPETEPSEFKQESPTEEKESLWWLIPVVLVVVGGGAGVFLWIRKKRNAEALF